MIVAGIILILILWALIEQKLLVSARYHIFSAKLPKNFDNTNFIVLADLHNCTFGKNNARLIKRIKEMSPEFIIVAGDMINKREICYPSSAFTLLECLAKQYKIYYAYGNHEQRMELIGNSFAGNTKSDNSNLTQKEKALKEAYSTWVEYKEKLRKLNVVFLDNESNYYTKNHTNIRITGVSIGQKYFERNKLPAIEEKYLESLIGESSPKEYQLLIAHNPVFFMDYARWGADLTISGHLHGGMVRLPGVGGVLSPQAKFFPKYHSGNHTEDGQQMVVSRGLGSHSVMPRLFNVPEIVQVILKCE